MREHCRERGVHLGVRMGTSARRVEREILVKLEGKNIETQMKPLLIVFSSLFLREGGLEHPAPTSSTSRRVTLCALRVILLCPVRDGEREQRKRARKPGGKEERRHIDGADTGTGFGAELPAPRAPRPAPRRRAASR